MRAYIPFLHSYKYPTDCKHIKCSKQISASDFSINILLLAVAAKINKLKDPTSVHHLAEGQLTDFTWSLLFSLFVSIQLTSSQDIVVYRRRKPGGLAVKKRKRAGEAI